MPIANFTGAPLSGTVPLTVSFQGLSSNNVDAWSWDFGDGGMSTNQAPPYSYQTSGTYTVSFTVTNVLGGDTEVKTDYILVYPAVGLTNYPNWWTTRSVLIPGSLENDYAVVNQGQVKQMAYQAYLELEQKLPGGAGASIVTIINTLSLTNGNDAPITLGQLKNIAQPFYDRLTQVGYQGGYPWTSSTNDDEDFNAANIGQLKTVFSFMHQIDTLKE